MNIIGKDCENIILKYKKELEIIDFNEKQVDNCFFGEFDNNLFDDIFSDINFMGRMNEIEKRYYLNNYTVGQFQEYYLKNSYFMKITFKFLIENQTEDYFQINIKCINNFFKNLKISYIYKLNSFNICIYLSNFKEEGLHELYNNITKCYI